MTTDTSTEDVEMSTERTITFWMTLAVTTLIVGFAAFVLSFAMLSPGGNPSAHRTAVSSTMAAS